MLSGRYSPWLVADLHLVGSLVNHYLTGLMGTNGKPRFNHQFWRFPRSIIFHTVFSFPSQLLALKPHFFLQTSQALTTNQYHLVLPSLTTTKTHSAPWLPILRLPGRTRATAPCEVKHRASKRAPFGAWQRHGELIGLGTRSIDRWQTVPSAGDWG